MDHLSPTKRSANMRQIKSKGMKPELTVRRLVHSMGYRYRLYKSDLPGKPDLVLTKLKKVIFVHGCFWHQHAALNCRHCHTPRSNHGYWKQKLLRNVKRDKVSRGALKKAGWDVLVLWECQLKKTDSLLRRLKRFLEA